MKTGINSRVMKVENALLVLEEVLRRAPISRSELVGVVGLTQVSVINVTNMLIENGILVAVGSANSGGSGRKSVVLDVNENSFFSVGVELSVGKLRCAICNAKGNPVDFEEIDLKCDLEPQFVVDEIAEIIDVFCERNELDRKKIIGVGVAAPGPLDGQEGVLINPPNFPKWKNVAIKKMLEKRLELKVCLDKETNLAALAESFYGVAQGYQTTFFLSLFRLGVGGGLISRNNIFHGFRDGAGEVGHLPVETGGRKCSCGNYGCLETMIAEKYVTECVQHEYKIGIEGDIPEKIEIERLEDVFEQCGKGDPICEAAVKKMASYISISIGSIVNVFSPEIIVLGGDLPEMSDLLVDMVKERTWKRPYPVHCKEVKIVKSKFGKMAYVRGAVALAQKKFLINILPEN